MNPMRMRVDFDHIFWCRSYRMVLPAAPLVRPPAPTTVVSIVTLLISLVLISVGIHVPTTAG